MKRRDSKVIKLKRKKSLTSIEQMALARDKLLDATEEVSDKVSVPNMVKALQHFTCELAFDTAPNHLIAVHLLQQIINYHLTEILDEQLEECENGDN